jgi:DNA-binding CsgD family transcriptional regulator
MTAPAAVNRGPRNPAVPRYPVTRRELQFLRLAANGHTNRAIARQLGVSPDTVNSLLAKTYRKLGVADRTHASTVALRLGLLLLDEITLPARLEQPKETS